MIRKEKKGKIRCKESKSKDDKIKRKDKKRKIRSKERIRKER